MVTLQLPGLRATSVLYAELYACGVRVPVFDGGNVLHSVVPGSRLSELEQQ